MNDGLLTPPAPRLVSQQTASGSGTGTGSSSMLSQRTPSSSARRGTPAQAAAAPAAPGGGIGRSAASKKPAAAVPIRNPYLKKPPAAAATFVEGAEKARRDARAKAAAGGRKKRPAGTRIVRPDEREALLSLDEALPKRLNPFDRFFASLLRTTASELCGRGSGGGSGTSSAAQQQHEHRVWSTICRRAGLAPPAEPVAGCYGDDASAIARHFDVRAALVLEEARCVLAQELNRKWQSCQYSASRIPGTMASLSAHYVESNNAKLGSARIVFHKTKAALTPQELYHLRSGTVYEIVARDGPRSVNSATLGVVSGAKRESTEKSQCFEVVVYNKSRLPSTNMEGTEWTLTPIAGLLTECRCFEAMTLFTSGGGGNHGSRNHNHNNGAASQSMPPPSRMPFIHCLVGNKSKASKHTRFQDSDDDDSDSDVENHRNAQRASGGCCPRQQSRLVKGGGGRRSSSAAPPPPPPFNLPKLNATQEKAAATFLRSKPNSITLIQGPPGTGKTTLLVSLIGRYYMQASEEREDGSTWNNNVPHFQDELSEQQQQQQQQQDGPPRRRLMVCAPTNKAISVLASRFLDMMNHDACDCNVLMVGDADKLLHDERSGSGSGRGAAAGGNDDNGNQMRSVFLYQWMHVVCEEYRKIRDCFLPGGGRGWTPEMLFNLAHRLEKRLLQNLPGLPASTIALTTKVSLAMFKFVKGNKAAAMHYDLVPTIERLLAELHAIPQDVITRQLLLSSDVIFCTLASAGGLLFKNYMNRIDDLIVDEAAASSEPEISIPLHMQPSRMLLVGDPQQLPATVTSRRAIDLGLAKSLQERLMFDCKYEYLLLDVQYRMNPEISAFPSSRFYNSKIANGENVSHPDYPNRSQLRLLDGRPYTFLQIAGLEEQGHGGSYRNPAEVQVIVDLLAHLQAQSQAQRLHLDPAQRTSWCSADRIRVITYYKAQVALLKRSLRERNLEKVVVSTVDSSQGCEADIVLVSFVRSQGSNSSNGNLRGANPRYTAGFLADDRRMNVSLTRARHQLICVGNAHQMMSLGNDAKSKTLQLLASDASDRNLVDTYMTEFGRRQQVNTQLDRFYGPASTSSSSSSSNGDRFQSARRATASGGSSTSNNKKPRYARY